MTLTVSPPRAEVHIDLPAYRRNLNALRERLVGDAQLWAVVKANAYGHDVDRVAQEAVAAGARRLCVATLSEARHLRQVGIRVPMLIMGPLDAASIRRAVDLDVSVAALNINMIDALIADAAASSSSARVSRVHLKVDTGMGRWGVAVEDALDLIVQLDAAPGIEVEGVMTHFATADDTTDTSFFELQLDRFSKLAAAAKELVPGLVAHAANSAATLRSDASHFDAVRCGVATYGLDPMQLDAAAHGLEPVLSMRSYVADVRALAPGESTGYTRSYVASHPVLVAEVPIGYADGIRRSLANRGTVLIRGRVHDIVGNVSMDHVSVLVDADVQVGDVVTLLGRDGDELVTAEDHARWADTINYEITCGIAGEPRLLRVHTSS